MVRLLIHFRPSVQLYFTEFDMSSSKKGKFTTLESQIISLTQDD